MQQPNHVTKQPFNQVPSRPPSHNPQIHKSINPTPPPTPPLHHSITPIRFALLQSKIKIQDSKMPNRSCRSNRGLNQSMANSSSTYCAGNSPASSCFQSGPPKPSPSGPS